MCRFYRSAWIGAYRERLFRPVAASFERNAACAGLGDAATIKRYTAEADHARDLASQAYNSASSEYASYEEAEERRDRSSILTWARISRLRCWGHFWIALLIRRHPGIRRGWRGRR